MEKYAELKPYYQDQFTQMDADPNFKGRFNFFAFFFSFLWLLSKGVVKEAMILLVISIACNVATQMTGIPFSILTLFLCVLFGIKGNKLYYVAYNKKNQNSDVA